MKPRCTLDIECFSNWFLVGFTDMETGMTWDFHLMPGSVLDLAGIQALLHHYTVITFNGNDYDILVLTGALAGFDNARLKELNDAIIHSNGTPSWITAKAFGLYTPKYLDHVDVMSVVPGVPIGLKLQAGRMHVKHMVDSPVDFKAPMPFHKINEETRYCQNDRFVTGELAKQLDGRLQLRETLSARYGVDLRSKSDAQIAEAVVKAEWQRRVRAAMDTGLSLGSLAFNINKWDGTPQPIKRKVPHLYSFKYTPPEYISFITPQMQEVFQNILTLDFVVHDKEEADAFGANPDVKIKTGVKMPEYLKKLVIQIGKSRYKMGIGGLHSQESNTAHITLPGVCRMKTADVASYYPSLMLQMGVRPEALGDLFAPIYSDIKIERLEAKAKKKDPAFALIEGGLKIVLNGTFGKLWSKHSIFFSPEDGIRVTITGQLALLMLIERLELAGITVVSANTDGIEMKVPEGLEAVVNTIMAWWEGISGLEMEQEYYDQLWSRDVNNYIRIDAPGKIKRKGLYRESGVLLNKTPKYDICAEAVVQKIANGRSIRETISDCKDIRMFVVVRKAGEGGRYHTPHNPVVSETGGVYLGKAVRWYYSTFAAGCYIANQKGDKVAESDGCIPCMTLPDEVPGDLDLERYIAIAEMMHDELTIPF